MSAQLSGSGVLKPARRKNSCGTPITKEKELSVIVIVYAEISTQSRRLTVPPVTDNPAIELVAGSRRAGRTVPLQSGGVDEEAVAAWGRTAVAKVDAYWLPAGVGDLGGVHVHGPVVCQRIDMI
jgi:hypothetical protein